MITLAVMSLQQAITCFLSFITNIVKIIFDTTNYISPTIVALGTVALAVTAYKGLSTWKTQLKKEQDHGLAYRLLIAITKLKNSVQSARNPFIPPPSSEVELEIQAHEEKIFSHTYSIYQSRLKKIDDNFMEIKSLCEEAQAIWNIDTKKLLEKTYRSLLVLKNEIQCLLIIENPKSLKHEILKAYRSKDKDDKIIYSSLSENSTDTFYEEFEGTLKDIKELVNSKLIRDA
ncbi:MAG: hypothetical protein JW739_07025 [Opitutales bacterium]|nr:hypothetical protein [Opitutales bacterium]